MPTVDTFRHDVTSQPYYVTFARIMTASSKCSKFHDTSRTPVVVILRIRYLELVTTQYSNHMRENVLSRPTA